MSDVGDTDRGRQIFEYADDMSSSDEQHWGDEEMAEEHHLARL